MLNAADYGVAQKRERVFIVGFRSDLAVTPNPVGADAPFPIRRIADDPPRHGPHWPFLNPTHSLDALLADQWVSGDYWDRHRIPRAARGACPAASRGRVARLRDRGPTGDRAWRTVRDALAGLPDPEIAPQAARAIADHRFQPGAKFYPGHTGSSLDLPAKTIKAGDHGVPGGENALVRLDGTGRYFTVRESARLQSFPDSYVFGGSWSEVMRQLGNAVPVALAHAVAAAVARTLTPREAGSAARTVALV